MEQLSTLFSDKIGQEIALSDIYRIAAEITARYSHDGYVLSSAVVPPQDIKDGTVTIAVVEGSIGEVHTAGNYHETAITRSIIDHIQSMRPLNAKALERDVLLLNDLGGAIVQAVLEPMSGKSPPAGAVAVRLIFSDKPGIYTATIDNLASRYLGPEELSLSASHGGIITPYDQLTLSTIGSLDFSELQYVSTAYTVPLWQNGLSAQFSGGLGSAHPGYRLEPENLWSHSSNIGGMLSWTAIRQRAENLTIGGGFAIKNIHSEILGSELYYDKLRELRASIIYTLSDQWGGANTVDVELVQGLNILGASLYDSAFKSRPDGHAEFTKLTISANRLQDLSNGFQIYAAMTGQVTNRVLLTTEEFGYGGQQFGRAYDASEILGDDGLAGSFELRYSGFQPIPKLTGQPFVFYDVGKAWNIDAGGITDSGQSVGFGVRFSSDFHLSGTLLLAQPLSRPVAANSPNHGHDPRGFFSISYQF